MIVELRDGATMEIIPESVAEQEVLLRFDMALAELEQPQPFTANVFRLVLKAQAMEEEDD